MTTVYLVTLLAVLAVAPGAAGAWRSMLRSSSGVDPLRQWGVGSVVEGESDYPSVEAWRSMLVPDGAPTGTPAETALIPGKGVR